MKNALAFAAVALLVAACDPSKSYNADEVLLNEARARSAAAAPSEAAGNSQTVPNQQAKTAGATPISLGQAGEAKGVTFTITGVSTPAQISSISKTEAGETFVVATYVLKNTAAVPLTYSSRPEINLVDNEGRTYARDGTAGILAEVPGGSTSVTDDLNPNVSARAAAAWKVDANAFDKAKWRVVLSTDPQLTFALQ